MAGPFTANVEAPSAPKPGEDEGQFALRADAPSFAGALKRAREARGLDEDTAAAMFGLSWNEYHDLEAYRDEWWDVLPVVVVANVAHFFAIDWRSCGTWISGEAPVFQGDESMDTFCRRLREQRGLSREEFADKVGFYEAFANVVEDHSRGLQLYPLVVTQYLAAAFGLDGLPLAQSVMTRPRAT